MLADPAKGMKSYNFRYMRYYEALGKSVPIQLENQQMAGQLRPQAPVA